MSDANEPSQLTARLRAVISLMRRRLREQASIGDFTASQSAALQRLESEGPMTVSALTRAEGLRPQSMGAIIAVLEAQRLVAGTPDPRDGRQPLFALTSLAWRGWLKDALLIRTGFQNTSCG